MNRLRELMSRNFLEYASYVIKERAIPDVDDGMKPVQRRILHSMWEMEDSKYNKVANVIGHTMKYHPHGDASIGDALVNLAQKEFFIDTQGNFGNVLTGDPASAPRYIECRLTPLSKEVLFNSDITEFSPSYDGRNLEPVVLPCKVPTLLMTGADGIAVGLSTKILPHNFIELLEAQIAILKGEEFEVYPDFQQGGMIDVSAYGRGNGKVKIRAAIEIPNTKTLRITEIPFGRNTESLISSIEAAAKKGKIKISAINDYTTDKVEIEIRLARGYQAEQTIDALYAFTDCEMTICPIMTVICDGRPVIMDTHEVLHRNTSNLVRLLTRELEIERDRLREQIHRKTLEQIFIEEKVYKLMEDCGSNNEILIVVKDEMQKFRDRLLRDVTDEDVETLVVIPIRRISRFDIDKSRKEVAALEDRLAKVLKNLSNITSFSINYIKKIVEKYRAMFPRRTRIESFGEVIRSEVTHETIKVGYDPEKGYLGTSVKNDDAITCTPYDKLLLFFDDGSYEVRNVPEKLFFEKPIVLFRVSDKKEVYNCFYSQGGADDRWFVKRFRISSFILEKEYRFIDEGDRLGYLSDRDDVYVTFYFKRKSRMKVFQQDMRFEDYLVKGVTSKGNLISGKEVSRWKIKEIPAPKGDPSGGNLNSPGASPAEPKNQDSSAAPGSQGKSSESSCDKGAISGVREENADDRPADAETNGDRDESVSHEDDSGFAEDGNGGTSEEI